MNDKNMIGAKAIINLLIINSPIDKLDNISDELISFINKRVDERKNPTLKSY